MSHEAAPGIFDLLAMDGFGIIGTVGFFVPAALLIVIVVGAVVSRGGQRGSMRRGQSQAFGSRCR